VLQSVCPGLRFRRPESNSAFRTICVDPCMVGHWRGR
jgi:hypothetical protein